MRTKEFLSRLEHHKVVEAIKDVEKGTSAEVRVFLQRGRLKKEILPAAIARFHQLGMQKTEQRNGVLIYVAPRMRQFAIIGDQGIHEKCGNDLWQRAVAKMAAHFRNDKFTEALVDAIQEVGRALTQHFPSTGRNQNELPDDLVEG